MGRGGGIGSTTGGLSSRQLGAAIANEVTTDAAATRIFNQINAEVNATARGESTRRQLRQDFFNSRFGI